MEVQPKILAEFNDMPYILRKYNQNCVFFRCGQWRIFFYNLTSMRCFTEHVGEIKVYFIYCPLNLNLLFEPFFFFLFLFVVEKTLHLNLNYVRVPYGRVDLKLVCAVLLNTL